MESINSNTIRTTRLGFHYSRLAAILTLSFVVLALIFVPKPWKGIEAYAADYEFLDMLNFIPVMLLTVCMIVVMACLHIIAAPSAKIHTLISLSFTIVYTTLISLNYYLQIFTVRLSLQSGELEGLGLFAMPNFHSAFFALETIGYGFLSLGTLFASGAFSNAGIEGWIKRLFVLGGAIGLVGAITAPLDQPFVIFALLGLWALVFPASMILLSIWFKNHPDSGTAEQ